MENICQKERTEKHTTILNTIILLMFIFIGYMLLHFPKSAGEGVSEGINLCLETLIPSMFPFLFVSMFLINSGLLKPFNKLFSSVANKLFRLSGTAASVFIFSLFGGLPLGPKMTQQLYEKRQISKSQGQKMLLFCMNSGPAFVITSVGHYMIGSEKAGIIIYVSLILSSLLSGIFFSKVWNNSDEDDAKEKYCFNNTPALSKTLVNSVLESSKAMLNICAWVILFSCLTALINTIPGSVNIKIFILSITEITTGSKLVSQHYPPALLAGIIGFGGICAHLQVMEAVISLGLKIKYFICARILNAGISVLISLALFEIFPPSISTFSIGKQPEEFDNMLSLPLCIGIIIMCFLLLTGDNYKIKKRTKKQIKTFRN